MPQNVPEFEFSDNAKQVRAFVFDFWCEHGRGPTLREVHQATELDRRRIIAGVQGAPARHRHRRRRGHAELQPAEGAAVLVVPVAGARVHRRRVPLVRRLRERGGRVLAHAAVQGQDRAARVALRVLLHAGHARLEELRDAVGDAAGRLPAHLAVAVRLEQRRHEPDVRLDELRARRRARRALRDGRPRRAACS